MATDTPVKPQIAATPIPATPIPIVSVPVIPIPIPIVTPDKVVTQSKPTPKPSIPVLPKDPKERAAFIENLRKQRLQARKDGRDARLVAIKAKIKEVADKLAKATPVKQVVKPKPNPRQDLHKLSHDDLVKKVSTPEGIAEVVTALLA